MKSHFRLSPSIAIAGTASLLAPIAADAQITANDVPTNAPYLDGWQAGDNGGIGLGPWDFNGTYLSPVGQVINSTSLYNNLGTAWTLYNADAPPDPLGGTDVSQAGRAIIGNLQVGQTISVVIDNPAERRFFRGYTVRFNTGGGNTVYAGVPESRMAVGTFEYFTTGQWYAIGTGGDPTLFDTDTDAGMRIDLLLTGADTFDLTMTPLDNPGMAFTKSGTLAGPLGSPIDWVEFELFNTDSDFYPDPTAEPKSTDFYISSITIEAVPEVSPAAAGGVVTSLALLTWGLRKQKKRPPAPKPGREIV